MLEEIMYIPIGVIHTPYLRKEDTPIQGYFSPNNQGYIEVFPEYSEGLKDIEGFSHLILIYHFHQVEGYQLLAEPFLDKGVKGIFSIRYYARPNPIGLSIVRLCAVKKNILEVRGVDMLDSTPLLDIKPYVSQFDIKEDVKNGWYPTASERAKYKVE